MKTQIQSLLLALACIAGIDQAAAQNTVFTYQGCVTDNGTNFTGAGQFQFALVTSTNLNHTATGTADAPSGGYITGYAITAGGNGYVTAPAVTVFGGGGSGATATATISGGVVTGISTSNPGNGGYTSAPTVIIAPPPANILYTTYWSNDGTSSGGSEPAASVVVAVANGLFTVVLGDPTIPNMSAASAALFNQPNLQLRIWFNDGVNGFAALNPVQNLTPTPYAVNALSAGTAANLAAVVQNNIINGGGETVGGGNNNATSNVNSTISGGANNLSTGNASTVGGGSENQATGDHSAVFGGQGNTASGDHATIGGGLDNTASGDDTTIGGGSENTATNEYATISGGQGNTASGAGATVGGGFVNNTGGYAATISGGEYNAAGGGYSTVAGGVDNSASGEEAFAAGQYANATLDGSFVWNSFPNAATALDDHRFHVFGANGLDVEYNTQRSDGGGTHWAGIGIITGQTIATWTGAYLSDSGVWQNASDMHRKMDFAPVDSRQVLAKLTAMPLQSWRYTNETDSVRHLGPTAQDFKATFGLGTDDKTIGTLDESGVALAAIQGLNQKENDKDAEIQKLKQQNDLLVERLDALEAAVKKLATPK